MRGRRFALAGIAAAVAVLVSSSPIGADPARTARDSSYRQCTVDVPPAALPTAECTAIARTDTERAEIRILSSVITPAFGTLPGWGKSATNSVLTLRTAITSPRRQAAFAVRLRVGPFRVTEPLTSGSARVTYRIHARHLGCAACRVYGKRLGGSTRGAAEEEWILTFRDRERKRAVMPAGPVDIIVEARSEAAMYPPYAGAVLIPPGVPFPVAVVPVPGEASAGGTLRVLGVEAA